MKKLIIILLFASLTFAAESPFHRGVNMSNWFQADSPGQIQFSRHTEQDLIDIKSLGCDVVRLPINLHAMTDGEPYYNPDELFIDFLDQVVAWCYNLDLHLILDNHTFDVNANTTAEIREPLIKVWQKVAMHYSQHPAKLYYEVLNEPHGITDILWNDIQAEVVDSIRTVDTTHTIIVGPASWNSFNNLKNMPIYTDDNLVYTFHFYDPFLFTHQGASWSDPSMEPLAGVPFPYQADAMPGLPSSFVGSWIQSAYNDYSRTGTVASVKEQIDIAVEFLNTRDVALYCGEFGVYDQTAPADDRVYWYQVVRSYLEENGISWTTWDYTDDFGLFEKDGYDQFDYDLNIPIIEALGLNVPEQKERGDNVDTTGFDIFKDYIGPNIDEAGWGGDGTLSFYSPDAVIGEYCIHWSNAAQYEVIRLDFRPDKDLSLLLSMGYALDFWVKGDTPGNVFDVRFLDTDTDVPEDHPWRMRMTIDSNLVSMDGQWHHLQVPLSQFSEQGAWEDEWFEPVGDFDWTAVDHFEIVAEHGAMTGMNLYFDQIRIVDPAVTQVEEAAKSVDGYTLYQNHPNPFNPVTRISYDLPVTGNVELAVYNMRGQLVQTLVSGTQPAGRYHVNWNAAGHPSGVYFYRLQGEGYVEMKKMVLVK